MSPIFFNRRAMSAIRILAVTIAAASSVGAQAQAPAPAFGPANPFFAPSTLPFHAPLFDKIKDSDYQPAIDAGIAEKMREIATIANNPAPPDFANTVVALEKSGQLLDRVEQVFGAIAGANTNPTIQKIEENQAPKLSQLTDAEMLNPKLFARVAAIYKQRDAQARDPESRWLIERTYARFIHAGANLSDADKARLKKINEQLSVLENAFKQKLLAAAKACAFTTTDKAALDGLPDGEIAAAELAAKARKQPGYVLPLQNTTQQPALQWLSNRATRTARFR